LGGRLSHSDSRRTRRALAARCCRRPGSHGGQGVADRHHGLQRAAAERAAGHRRLQGWAAAAGQVVEGAGGLVRPRAHGQRWAQVTWRIHGCVVTFLGADHPWGGSRLACPARQRGSLFHILLLRSLVWSGVRRRLLGLTPRPWPHIYLSAVWRVGRCLRGSGSGGVQGRWRPSM